MNRIEWDPLDAAIATCVRGRLRLHEGTHVRDIAPRILDMRWLADGPLFTVDGRGRLGWWRDGEMVDEQQRVPDHAGDVLVDAAIAAGGARFVALDAPSPLGPAIVSVASRAGTMFQPRLEGARPWGLQSAAISGDGTKLAIAYDTGEAGRGIAVWDIDEQTLIDRTWAAQPIDRSETAKLELDLTGKRLVTAVPEVGVASLGAIRIGAGEVYPRKMPGGVSAVAIELRGQLAAYAFREAPPGARGRLRFDYLEPAAKGGVGVEILDTQTLEVELPDVVAMAFSRDRRRLACLASTGAIEIVPVP